MKRIFNINLLGVITLILLSIFVSLCDTSAQTIVKSGQIITASDTVTTEIQLNNTIFNPSQIVYIQLDSANTGTIKFAVSKTGSTLPITPMSKFKSYGAGAKFPISIDNGRYNLFYKASSSGNSFIITE